MSTTSGAEPRVGGRGNSKGAALLLRTAGMLIAFVLGAASVVPASAQAQYPNRPIRIVVPFGPGGFADITVRLLAQKLAERTNAQVVIENRPGAGGIIDRKSTRLNSSHTVISYA